MTPEQAGWQERLSSYIRGDMKTALTRRIDEIAEGCRVHPDEDDVEGQTLFIDLFSRYVVAWMVAARESATRAKRLIRNACQKQGIQAGQLTLHQDRGAPMTAKTFSQLLIDLDILASYSRPRTSDDNPYSESHFKTVKYAPTYPGCFADPQEARSYFQSFFPWYNTHHRHSGIGLLTPDAVHYGRANEIQAARQRVLNDVYTQHPERFVNGPPRPPQVPGEVWINQPQNTIECERIRQ